jgi:hypothetical protein
MIRYGVPLLYIVLICGLAYFVGQRASSVAPHVVAARDLPANQEIRPDDVVPIDRDKLIGRHLQAAVKLGEPITQDNLMVNPVLANEPNSIAAIIAAPAWRVVAESINAGTMVQICLGGQPYGPAAKVLWTSCPTNECSVAVNLSKMSQQIDPGSLAGASVNVASPQAHCPRP